MNRLSILWHYLHTRRNFTRWTSRASLEAWQDQQVLRHLAWVREHSPIYAEAWSDHSLTEWPTLPIVEKTLLMRRFDDWNTAGIKADQAWSVAQQAERSRDFSPTIRGITVGLSSGTSGSRGIFLASKSERARWAGTLLGRILRGTLHQSHRAALFLRADSNLYQSIGSQRFTFTFFDLLQSAESQWPRLQELRPTILAAPPNALTKLATMPKASRLLAPPGLLFSVADVLDEVDRNLIEQGFGQPVGQLYQATEGFLAATCPHGSLHWNEDVLVVQKEWLDAAHTRYTPIITDFRRTTQPIIRFRLNDVIVASTKTSCPCGSVFEMLAAIEGRQDDVFYLPALHGNQSVTLFPDFVRRALILALPEAVDYTVTQTAPDHWNIALSRLEETSLITAEIRQLCATSHAQMPELTFTLLSPQPASEKRRRVRRTMPEPT